jgi:hypothetical protein
LEHGDTFRSNQPSTTVGGALYDSKYMQYRGATNEKSAESVSVHCPFGNAVYNKVKLHNSQGMERGLGTRYAVDLASQSLSSLNIGTSKLWNNL